MGERFAGYLADVRGPHRDVGLTPRELDVLRCLSVGMREDMVADTLGISVETVESHRKKARYRLAAKNSTHAVALALRFGLIH